MNIKRGFFALAAMILGVGFLGAFPQQAQAAISCTKVVTHTIPAYPDDDWTQYCGTASLANGQDLNASISALQGQAINEMRRSPNRNFNGLNGVSLYIFGTPAEYSQWATEQSRTYQAPGPNDFGVLIFKAGTNIPEYIAIFMQNPAGVVNTNVKHRTGQQIGLAVDYLQGYIKNGGIMPPTLFRVSDMQTGWIAGNFNSDWTALNAQAPCKVGGVNGLFTGLKDFSGNYICDGASGTGANRQGAYVGLTNQQIMNSASWASIYQTNLNTDWQTLNGVTACGTTSLFRGLQDQNGNYICNGASGTGTALSATYTGKTNRQVLQQAWSAVYQFPKTIFAEQISFRYGLGSDVVSNPKTADKYFSNGYFACSRWLAGSITNKGNLPSAAAPDGMPAGCTLPTMTTKCQKIFMGSTGQFPYGNTFNCSGTVVASQTQTKLLSLGTNSAPAFYTPIRNKLDLERADVYFFANNTDYANAFSAAGELFGSIINKCGATAPVGSGAERIWQSIMNEGCSLANTPAKQAYVTAHELGHTIDLTDAQPSGLTDFNKAMQLDWAKLDYIDFPTNTKRKPCSSVVFGGTTYPAVLTGLTDKSGVLFCNGSALRTGQPWSGGVLISDILNLDNPAEISYLAGGAIGSPSVTVNPGWYEWYAQSLAIRARADLALGVSGSNHSVYDELVLDGYFECTAGPNGWLQQNYSNPSSGSKLATSVCAGRSLPAGWIDLLYP